MNRYKGLLIATVVLFVLVNTSYYWSPMIGAWYMLTVLLCVLAFVALLIFLMRQVYLLTRERFKNQGRIYLIVIMTVVLAAIAAKPEGIIDFESAEGQDLLVAWQKSTANCSTMLKLKTNKHFIMTSVCFGVERTLGTYVINGDTIRFSTYRNLNNKYEFAIYKPLSIKGNKLLGELSLYTSKKDTMPYPLGVYKNNLMK